MTAVSARVLREALAGHLEVESVSGGLRPWRLPAAARRHAAASLQLMAEFTSGVRLMLRTDADRLELDAEFVRLAMRHLGRPEAPARLVIRDRGRDHVIETDDTAVVVETADRRFERGPAVRTTFAVDLDPAPSPREITVWLPHDAGIVLHELRATRSGAPAQVAPSERGSRRRWLHHGSSISHGGSASLPTRTWPVHAAEALGVDVVNLGFGGNAMLDPDTARAIAATPADVITLKLGVNIVGGDAMRRRTFVPALHGFLDLVREGHPDTPVVVVSAIGCPALEDAPGPLRATAAGRVSATPREVQPGDGTLTLQTTRELLAEAVAERRADDPALGLLDGRRLLPPDEDALLPDGLHPGDEGYALMAERFAALAADPAEDLGAAFGAARRG